ncbi:hypothetical protein Q3O60_17480, partial [Alkalimonas collagenimarina]
KPYVVKDIFNAIKNSKSTALKKFLEKYAELKIIRTGVLNDSSLFETVLKSNREDCSLCKHTGCLSNRSVTRLQKFDLSRVCEIVHSAISQGLMTKLSLPEDEAKKAIAEMNIDEKRELCRRDIGWLFKF